METLFKAGSFGNKAVESVGFFEGCVMSKHHRLPFGTGIHSTKAVLDYIHVDLWVVQLAKRLLGETYIS